MSHRQHHANAAAGPLPIIPRRASSTRQIAPPIVAMSYPNKRHHDAAGPSTMQRSSSSSSESDSSSSHSRSSSKASPSLTIRARRVKAAHAQGHIPTELANVIPPLSPSHLEAANAPKAGGLRTSKTEDNITLSTNKPSTQQYLYTPGMVTRFGMESRATSNESFNSTFGDDSRLIRKKSGQLVKPSLKTSRSYGSEGLSMFGSKSEPATPVCKAVHFDSQLEHVKLFLAEQKPLAVSRDGSPTDDTSGTDSDFPSFIFGNNDDKRDRMKLIIRVVNMPSQINMRADVCLEEVSVSSGNNAILGQVRVRNIAFVKTVAVRFTFDSWQTTSEVIGHYSNSPCDNYDRFSFTIKLDDLLARIEDKTLVLAVRYSVAGREFWDNNNGNDYVAKFSRSAPRDRSLSDEESSENLVSLQNKLEKVVESKDRTGPAFSTSEREEPSFKSTSSLAARYDFNAAFKNPWKYHEASPVGHRRNNSFPQFAKPNKQDPLKTVPVLGSPRDLSYGAIPDTPLSAHIDGMPFEAPQHGRNHHRGYFDFSTFGAANVRRTPPTSPPASPISRNIKSFGRSYSFPPLNGENTNSPDLHERPTPLLSGLFSDMMGFDSALSTPSLATPTSSRSTTPSPTEQFLNLPPVADEESPLHPDTHYRELINQYCFFTGGTHAGQEVIPSPQKSLRSSDMDGTPMALSEPRMRSVSPLSSPMSSMDDLASTSGSITPTPSRLNLIDSRSPTPTACTS